MSDQNPHTTTVWAYDHTGSREIETPVSIGDDVQYKRRGERGSYRCRVLEIAADKIKVRPLWKYRGLPIENGRPIWIKKSVLRVYPQEAANVA